MSSSNWKKNIKNELLCVIILILEVFSPRQLNRHRENNISLSRINFLKSEGFGFNSSNEHVNV
jgi:hypothetical protein